MKLINKFKQFITKIGVDKLLHLFVGASLTLFVLFTVYVITKENDILLNTNMSVGGFILFGSIIKEQTNKIADYWDIVWAMSGCILASIYFWILFLMF